MGKNKEHVNILFFINNMAHYKPAYFQISPNDFKQRYCELKALKPFISRAAGYYKGGGEEVLSNQLKEFIKNNSCDGGDLVICVNTHGEEGSGEFYDYDNDSEFIWDAKMFGETLLSVEDDLKNYATVYIVFAQCFGGIFADSLESQYQFLTKIHIVGIKPVETESFFSGTETVDEFAQHTCLTKWFQQRIGKRATERPNPKPQSSMGAFTALVANSNLDYEDFDENYDERQEVLNKVMENIGNKQ